MKVSIVTVSYNSSRTIEDTIESVLNQTYADIEFIIVDGGSTDNTINIINRYKKSISKFISEKDEGIFDAFNKGIKLTTGDIIGILNSDDLYFHKDVISKVVEVFKNTNTQSVFSNLYYVNEFNTQKITRNWKSSPFSILNIYTGWMPAHPTFFVKKEIYDNYGVFDSSYKFSGDYELMLRFLFKNRITSEYINDYMVRMREGGNSNASIKARLNVEKEDRRALKSNGIKFPLFPSLMKRFRKIPQYLK